MSRISESANTTGQRESQQRKSYLSNPLERKRKKTSSWHSPLSKTTQQMFEPPHLRKSKRTDIKEPRVSSSKDSSPSPLTTGDVLGDLVDAVPMNREFASPESRRRQSASKRRQGKQKRTAPVAWSIIDKALEGTDFDELMSSVELPADENKHAKHSHPVKTRVASTPDGKMLKRRVVDGGEANVSYVPSFGSKKDARKRRERPTSASKRVLPKSEAQVAASSQQRPSTADPNAGRRRIAVKALTAQSVDDSVLSQNEVSKPSKQRGEIQRAAALRRAAARAYLLHKRIEETSQKLMQKETPPTSVDVDDMPAASPKGIEEEKKNEQWDWDSDSSSPPLSESDKNETSLRTLDVNIKETKAEQAPLSSDFLTWADDRDAPECPKPSDQEEMPQVSDSDATSGFLTWSNDADPVCAIAENLKDTEKGIDGEIPAKESTSASKTAEALPWASSPSSHLLQRQSETGDDANTLTEENSEELNVSREKNGKEKVDSVMPEISDVEQPPCSENEEKVDASVIDGANRVLGPAPLPNTPRSISAHVRQVKADAENNMRELNEKLKRAHDEQRTRIASRRGSRRTSNKMGEFKDAPLLDANSTEKESVSGSAYYSESVDLRPGQSIDMNKDHANARNRQEASTSIFDDEREGDNANKVPSSEQLGNSGSDENVAELALLGSSVSDRSSAEILAEDGDLKLCGEETKTSIPSPVSNKSTASVHSDPNNDMLGIEKETSQPLASLEDKMDEEDSHVERTKHNDADEIDEELKTDVPSPVSDKTASLVHSDPNNDTMGIKEETPQPLASLEDKMDEEDSHAERTKHNDVDEIDEELKSDVPSPVSDKSAASVHSDPNNDIMGIKKETPQPLASLEDKIDKEDSHAERTKHSDADEIDKQSDTDIPSPVSDKSAAPVHSDPNDDILGIEKETSQPLASLEEKMDTADSYTESWYKQQRTKNIDRDEIIDESDEDAKLPEFAAELKDDAEQTDAKKVVDRARSPSENDAHSLASFEDDALELNEDTSVGEERGEAKSRDEQVVSTFIACINTCIASGTHWRRDFESQDCSPFGSSGIMQKDNAIRALCDLGIQDASARRLVAYAAKMRESQTFANIDDDESTMCYLPFVNAFDTDEWAVTERVRCMLRRLAFDWGCSDDLRTFYCNFSQTDVDDVVSEYRFAEALDELGCDVGAGHASWILSKMHISYTPGDAREKLKKNYFSYPEFFIFIKDPNLLRDVLPRLYSTMKALSSADAEALANAFERKDRIGSGTVSEEDFVNILGAYTTDKEAVRLCSMYDMYGDSKVHYHRLVALAEYYQHSKRVATMPFPGGVADGNELDPAFRSYKIAQRVATINALTKSEPVCLTDAERKSQGGECEEAAFDINDFFEEDDDEGDEFDAELERALEEKDRSARGSKVAPLGSVSTYLPQRDEDEDSFIMNDDSGDEESFDSDLGNAMKAWGVDNALEKRGEARRLSPGRGDILDFAMYLGMDPEEDREFFWIAEETLYAPLPDGWCQARDHSSTGRGDLYYWKEGAEASVTWSHPLDKFFKALFERLKAEKMQREEEERMNRLNPSAYKRNKLKQARPQTAQALGRRGKEKSAGLNVMRRAVEKGVTGTSRSLTPRNAGVQSAMKRPQSALAAVGGRRNRNKIAPLAVGANDDEARSSEKRLQFGKLSWLGDQIRNEIDEENGKEHGVDYIRGIMLKLLPASRERSFWWFETMKRRISVYRRAHRNRSPAPLYGSAEPGHSDSNFFGLQPTPEDALLLSGSYFGLRLPEDAHLMWIAKLALVAPVPNAWRQCTDDDGKLFFASSSTFQICRHHPLDPVFALLIHVERIAAAAAAEGGIFDDEEASLTSWVRFVDDDGVSFYFNPSTMQYQYECPWPADISDAVGNPYLTMSIKFYTAEDMDAFMEYICSALELIAREGAGESSAAFPCLLSRSTGMRLEAIVLKKVKGLLDSLIEHKSKRLVEALEERDKLKHAVEERRKTSETLTKHIATFGTF